jgi:predicted  nucleic acid-binding Zn-ribbon protein
MTIQEDDEGGSSAWEGKLGALKSHFGQAIKQVEEKVLKTSKAIDSMQFGLEKQQRQSDSMKASMEEGHKKIDKKFDGVKNQVDDVSKRVEFMISLLQNKQ